MSHLDLVGDAYHAESLKYSQQMHSNKTKPLQFLSSALMEWFDQKDNQLIIIKGEQCSASQCALSRGSWFHCMTEPANATKASLGEHVKRIVYHSGHVWSHILLPAAELLSQTKWGWSRTKQEQYTPYWSRLPETAHSYTELVSFNCKKGCVRHCKWKKAVLQCTALWDCEWHCTW